jgi:hypothetical protein
MQEGLAMTGEKKAGSLRGADKNQKLKTKKQNGI